MLREYGEKAGGLPLIDDVERWKEYGLDSDDIPTKQEESSTSKRKVDAKSSKDEATTSRARDVSPLRKTRKTPFCCVQVFFKRGFVCW